MTKLLIIEDREEYRRAAREYFASQESVEVMYAVDYESAMNALKEPNINGVITDLFFPKETGSLDRSLGMSVIQKLRKSPTQRRYNGLVWDILAEFESLIPDMDDELRDKVVDFASMEAHYLRDRDDEVNPYEIPFMQALRTIVEDSKPKSLLGSVKQTIPKYAAGEVYVPELYKTEVSMRESANNQPLGILVAEEAESRGLHFVIATSTYHHGEKTNALCTYQRDQGWPEFVDVEESSSSTDKKNTPQFWERAHKKIIEQITGGK